MPRETKKSINYLNWKAIFFGVLKFYIFMVLFYGAGSCLGWIYTYFTLESMIMDPEDILTPSQNNNIDLAALISLSKSASYIIFFLVFFATFFKKPPHRFIYIFVVTFFICVIANLDFWNKSFWTTLENFAFFYLFAYLAWGCSVVWYKISRFVR